MIEEGTWGGFSNSSKNVTPSVISNLRAAWPERIIRLISNPPVNPAFVLTSYPPTTRVSRSVKRYPARIILRSAIRLALTTYPGGSTGAAATIVQS
jgi:hypothetical protein